MQETVLVVMTGEGRHGCWHLVGGGQGCCCDVQEGAHNKGVTSPNVVVPRLRNTTAEKGGGAHLPTSTSLQQWWERAWIWSSPWSLGHASRGGGRLMHQGEQIGRAHV